VAARATELDSRATTAGASLREPMPGVQTVKVQIVFRDRVAASLFLDEMLDHARVRPGESLWTVGHHGNGKTVVVEVRR
jgi:hypothetical protein